MTCSLNIPSEASGAGHACWTLFKARDHRLGCAWFRVWFFAIKWNRDIKMDLFQCLKNKQQRSRVQNALKTLLTASTSEKLNLPAMQTKTLQQINAFKKMNLKYNLPKICILRMLIPFNFSGQSRHDSSFSTNPGATWHTRAPIMPCRDKWCWLGGCHSKEMAYELMMPYTWIYKHIDSPGASF